MLNFLKFEINLNFKPNYYFWESISREEHIKFGHAASQAESQSVSTGLDIRNVFLIKI